MPAPAAVLQVLVTASTAQANAALAKTQAQLNATAATAERSTAATAKSTSKMGAAMRTAAKTGAVALAVGMVVSVKRAAEFDDAMQKIANTAGASQREVENLKESVLKLARSGSEHGPIDLANALYRVESAGFRGSKAMSVLAKAERLADVGSSDLEQTTTALVGAMKSGVKGAGTAAKSIGTLNAIVGAGNMRMEEFVSAMGTGFLSNARQMGVSLKQAGAALATLTVQGQPATAAATRLSMAFRMMMAPTAAAEDALKSIGLSATQLGQMMQAGNFPQAIGLLAQKLDELGTDRQGLQQKAAVIREIFGARSSSGINAIIQGLSDYQNRLKQVGDEAGKFHKKEIEDDKTLASRWNMLTSSVDSWSVSVGHALEGPARDLLMVLNKTTVAIAAVISFLAKYDFSLMDAGKAAGRLVSKIGNVFGSLPGVIKNALAGVGKAIVTPFIGPVNQVIGIIQKLVGAFRSIGGIKDVVVGAFHAIKDAADAVVRTVTKVINAFKTAASAPSALLDKARDALPFAKGGVIVPGHRSGDRVPAVLEAGEVVWNKRAVQAMGGAKRANAINQAVPRFAGGGLVGSAQGIVQGGTGLMNAEGMALLVLISKMVGGGNASGLLKAAQRMSAKHQPYLWGGGHAGFSANGPWDCSGAVSQILHEAGFPISAPMVSGALASYGLPGLTSDGKTGVFANSEHTFMSIAGKGYGTSAENPGGGFGGPLSYNSRPGFSKRHPDMSHVSGRTGQSAARGFQTGGIVQRLADGGIIAPMEHGKRWIKGGKHGMYNASQAATLAWQVGAAEAAAKLLSTKVQGESGGNSRAVSSDHGYGLWQITAPYQNRLINKYGGVGGVMIPPNNAAAAVSILGSEGIGAWYAPSSAAGRILKDAVGTRGLPPKPKTKGKTPKGSDAAGAGEPAWSLALPASLTNLISSLGGDGGRIAEAADFANRASTFATPIGGKDEIGWILEQLKLMEQLREAYIAMIMWIQTVIDRFQEAIAKAKDQIGKLRQGWGGLSPKQRKKRLEKITELKAKIGKWTGRRDISMTALTNEDTGPLSGLSALQDPVANKVFERAVGLNLADKAMWGVFGGPIADAQSSLKSAREAMSETGTGSASGDTSAANAPDNSALIALLQEQANNLAKQLYVSEQSYSVLAGIPFAGSFAKGGVVPGPVGAPRMAMVHGGEHIGQPQPIVILVQDGAVNPNYIRAISGRQADQMARRAGRGRIPGKAGSLT